MGRNLRLIKAFIILNLFINSCKGQLARFCEEPAERGPCKKHQLRYRWTEEFEYCVPFLYGGCEGNQNNFQTLDECVKACVDEPVTRCELPKDEGTCMHGTPTVRWHFNEDAETCQKFYYNGCQGNSNNFVTAKECTQTCGGRPVIEETTTSAPQVPSWVEPSQSSWRPRGNDRSSRHSSGEVTYPFPRRKITFRNNAPNSGRQGGHNQYNQHHRNMGNSNPQHNPHSHHNRNNAYHRSNHGPQQPPHGHRRNSPTHGQGPMNHRNRGNLHPQHGPGSVPRRGMENHHSRPPVEPSQNRENHHRPHRPGQPNAQNRHSPREGNSHRHQREGGSHRHQREGDSRRHQREGDSHRHQREGDSQRQRNFPTDQQARRHRQRVGNRGPPQRPPNHHSQRESGPPSRRNMQNKPPPPMSNSPPERNSHNRPGPQTPGHQFHENRPNHQTHRENPPHRNRPNSNYRNSAGGPNPPSHGSMPEKRPYNWNGPSYLTTTPQTREWNNNWGDNSNPNTYTRQSNGWNQQNSNPPPQQDRWSPQRGPPPANNWNSQKGYSQNSGPNSPSSRNSNQGNFGPSNWQPNGPNNNKNNNNNNNFNNDSNNNNNAWGYDNPSRQNSPPPDHQSWQPPNRPPNKGFRDSRTGSKKAPWKSNNYHNDSPRKGQRPQTSNGPATEPRESRWNEPPPQNSYNDFNRQWDSNKNWQNQQAPSQEPSHSTPGNNAEGHATRNDGRDSNRDQHFSDSMSFKRRRGRGRGRKRNPNMTNKKNGKNSPKWQRNRDRSSQPAPDVVEPVNKNSSRPIDNWSNHHAPPHEHVDKVQHKENVRPTSGHPQDWPEPHNAPHTNTGKWSNDPPQSPSSGSWSNNEVPPPNHDQPNQWNTNTVGFNDNPDKPGPSQTRNKPPNSNGPAWDPPVDSHGGGPEWLSNNNHNNMDKPNSQRNHNNKPWKNSETQNNIPPSTTPSWNTEPTTQPFSDPPMFEWLSSKDPEMPPNQNGGNNYESNFKPGGNTQSGQTPWRNSPADTVPHLENFSAVEIIKKQRIKRPSENAIPTMSEPLSTFQPRNNSWASFDSNGAFVVPMDSTAPSNTNNINSNNNNINNNNNPNEIYPSSFYPSPTNAFPDFLNSPPERRAYEYESRPTPQQPYVNSNPNNIPNPFQKINPVCYERKDEGNCTGRGHKLVYHYNYHSEQCEIFSYSGCGGNGNNFITRKECEDTCNVEKLPICEQDRDPGTCPGHLIRYFYNKITRRCEVFTYTGCQGNDNRFKQFDDCYSTCSYIADIDCSYPQDQGTCTEWTKRFSYNSKTRTCEPFSYGGCGGNRNNFKDITTCRNKCMR